MVNSNILTLKLLKSLFRYENGNLIRIAKNSNNSHIGDTIGTITNHGYLRAKINNKNYFVHRLIWMYHYGDMPYDQIDHINHIRSDNRIENLRVVSSAENNRNRSKVKLAYFHKQTGKWQASSFFNGKNYYFGLFDSQQDAINAKLKGIKDFNLIYHDNHGADNG